MNKRRILALVIVVALLGGLVAACAAPAPAPAPTPAPAPAPAPIKVYEWTLTTPYPPSLPSVPEMQKCAAAIEEATGGQVKITVLVKGQHQYEYRDGMRVITEDLAEISHTGMTYMTSVEPWWGLPLVPFAIPIANHMTFFLRWHEEILDDYMAQKYNVKTLGHWLDAGGWGNAIHTPVPLVALDSLKGLKVRCHDANTAFLGELLGVTPVTVPASELYVSVQRGAIDGIMTSLNGASSLKLWELLKHTNIYDPYFGVDEIFIDRDDWNDLDPGLQGIVAQHFYEILGPQPMYTLQNRNNHRMMEEAESEYGVTFSVLPSEALEQLREDCQPLYDKYLEDGGDMARQSWELAQDVVTTGS